MYTLLLLAAVTAGSLRSNPSSSPRRAPKLPPRDVLASVELIRRRRSPDRRPAAELGDALRFVPGVEVARLGGAGQQTSLFLRGTESNHVLVLMDGLRINPGTIGTAAIAEHRAGIRRARRGRQGTALDALRLRRDRRRHQRHHARRRRQQQRPGGLRQLRHDEREFRRGRDRRAHSGSRSRDPGSTARIPDARRRYGRPRLREHVASRPRRHTDVGPVTLRAPRLVRRGHVRILRLLPRAGGPGLRELGACAVGGLRADRVLDLAAHARARGGQSRPEPVDGLPGHEAQHDRLAERHRARRRQRR